MSLINVRNVLNRGGNSANLAANPEIALQRILKKALQNLSVKIYTDISQIISQKFFWKA
jgi:hypothetical protein